MTIRVLVADDQEMVRMGFALILDSAPDIEVVAQCADGVAAVAAVREHRPDVALLDIRMPRLDGLQVCRQVSGETRVVVVTTFNDDDYVDTALAHGATGFLLKDSGPDLLLAAVRAAVAGDALIGPELTTGLLRRTHARAGRRVPPELAAAIAALSPRELEVTRLVAQGATNAEIGERLHLSLGTVKTHIASVQRRLSARNRVEVAARAWRAGLMD
ncbi:response regulator transcription factor [Nocardia otitidiscaviarum]|uniref:response regulator n=1 Tax=Nocardia otitidiscaviarum TaxID=1823 RepID=UPI0004A72A44|nr:response regulator transcription factor [Nocardia otitidiscaviarum]MBF6135070.1 response regulator transcription factor [Nocardia otitidiscaviarum]MBF6486893.1 response regulator transcription factor [Nocardia otitidiscaviarum]